MKDCLYLGVFYNPYCYEFCTFDGEKFNLVTEKNMEKDVKILIDENITAKKLEKLSNWIKEYKEIIVCSNGSFRYLNLKLLSGKYIRVKGAFRGDYIVDTEDYEAQTNTECNIPKERIVKRSNKIEELFDIFVYEEGGIYHFITSDDLDFAKEKQLKVYGAVWTKLGCNFIAELNEKGEWELE